MTDIEIWTYRQQSSPKIIHDYLENSKKKDGSTTITIMEEKALLKSASMRPAEISDYVIGRMEHICKGENQKKL